MSYNVVYEYNKKAGGYTGIRFFTSFNNKEEYEASKLQKDNDSEICNAIADGLTVKQAQDLTALTPEVCRLTAAVQEACYDEDGTIGNPSLLPHQLFNSAFAILHDREAREESNQLPLVPYITVEIGPENTERNQLLRYVMEYCNSFDGTVRNLKYAIKMIEIKADLIVESRQE